MSSTPSGLARSRRAEHRTVRLELARTTVALLGLVLILTWALAFTAGAWWSSGQALVVSPSVPFPPGFAPQVSADEPTAAPEVVGETEAGSEQMGASASQGEPGLDGTLPEPPDEPEPAAPAAQEGRARFEKPPRGRWGLQLGAFETSEEALEFVAKLDDLEQRQFITAVDLGPRGTWFRVRVGAFQSKGPALRLRRRLKDRVPDDPLVVRYE